jgi:SAM-dependent methyltransferase
MGDPLCCPICKGALAGEPSALRCPVCQRSYPIRDGIADFFLAENEGEAIDPASTTWLDPEIVAARETTYTRSVRHLKGMVFCMAEIAWRARPGCRILEACAGTGHFTQWLVEVLPPDAEIAAFDFSWPILAVAQARLRGLPGVTLCRANARWRLPFPDASFDILLLRLAPLGPAGVTAAAAACRLLHPGGWFFRAGWAEPHYETPPTTWALQYGFESAEYHTWQYPRWISTEEDRARKFEQERLFSLNPALRGNGEPIIDRPPGAPGGGIWIMTTETLLIAQAPSG